MAHKAAVVIPVYKDELNEFEKISLAQVQKVLSNYRFIFVAPHDKDFFYLTKDSRIYFFPPQFFKNKYTYSDLMKTPIFYEAFLDYEYILIYQLDAFVFSDELEYFCGLGYDYIGAPWCAAQRLYHNNKVYKAFVGNGGFSLRKVKSFYNLLSNVKVDSDKIRGTLEDVFFALCGKLFPNEFKVAPLKVAIQFSMEFMAERFVKKNGGKLPFGCHAWHKMSKNFYTKVIPKFGYDLKKLSSHMKSEDIISNRKCFLDYAMHRLIHRFQHDQSIMRYLPPKNFSSIRVFNNQFAMMILEQLIHEKINFSDKIFLYNEDEQDILIQDLKSEKMPHLIITDGRDFDNTLIDKITKLGMTYGDDFVSFNKEYLNYCEKLFHNLGK